jgi:hypothetical protein
MFGGSTIEAYFILVCDAVQYIVTEVTEMLPPSWIIEELLYPEEVLIVMSS